MRLDRGSTGGGLVVVVMGELRELDEGYGDALDSMVLIMLLI